MIGLEPLTQELIWMALPVILVAGLVHGTFGVGFPMVATPLLALFTDVLTAMLITLLPTVAVNITLISQGGRERLKDIRQHLLIVPFALIGTVIGTLCLLWLDPRPFLLLLAGAILLYLNQDRLLKKDFSWVRRHTVFSYIIFGLTAGLMAGTVNVMLPVLIILFLELGIASASMIVLFNINFLTGKLTQSLLFLQQDLPGIEVFLLNTLWLVPVALFALYLGSQLRKRITEERYLKVLRGILWIIAGLLVVRYLHASLL